MQKRLFQILDEMNQSDIANGTRMVSISPNFISGDKVKQGAKICMGTDEAALMELFTHKSIPLLIIVNSEEYNRLKDTE
ncbi:hypothetical protein OU798_07575 [Prolixibacteraceae bacterium Z1-6]|uniref:Uncharacterized protein n=1 Tax=Draconibacterium aestuarii TaxID=2998507 RepID=A0A9X3F5H5_9BACT|nr:hypothetical protein [Prolixibacteraceae bacterium Z1-6]